MNDDYSTPPVLGATPAYISSGRRIKELAEAIARASAEANNYPGHIEMYAREIISHVNIIRENEYCNPDRVRTRVVGE